MGRSYGARYLLVDAANGYPADVPALSRAGRVVYRAPTGDGPALQGGS